MGGGVVKMLRRDFVGGMGGWGGMMAGQARRGNDGGATTVPQPPQGNHKGCPYKGERERELTKPATGIILEAAANLTRKGE